MRVWQYWMGWSVAVTVTFTASFVVLRVLIVQPLLDRMDALLDIGARLEALLKR